MVIQQEFIVELAFVNGLIVSRRFGTITMELRHLGVRKVKK